MIKVGELVMDFSIYPRVSVDATHIRYMREAVEAGVTLPPIIICKKTRRIVDGFHRCRLYLAMHGGEHEVEVIEKTYRQEADILADAIRYNAAHGRALTRYDRVHCCLLGDKLELPEDVIAGALQMTVETLKELRLGRVGKLSIPGDGQESVPLKRTLAHMSGKTLTPAQAEANERAGGMSAMFYTNQLISLLENDLLDVENEALIARVKHLGGLIRKLKIAA